MTTTVIGGTGKTGARVATRLTALGDDVRVASRSTSGFDWDRPDTWDDAVRGASAVYLTYAPDLAFPGAAEQVSELAARAVRHGCGRIVLLSGRGEPAAQQAEKYVFDSGGEVTVLRCAVFAQNFSESFLHPDVVAGEIVLPAGDTAEPFVDADDIADAAVVALREDGHAGRVYELTGGESITFTTAAQVLSSALGREIGYRAVSVDDYRAMLPADVPGELADLFGFIFDGHNSATADGVTEILGHAPRRFADYIRSAAGTGVWDVR